jgi:acyl-CoA thioesterase II
MSSAVQDLLAILDLERLELNLFRGRSPQVGWQRVFGGQVIGQALVAACRTVDVVGRPPHSLHAYFLLPGDPKVPIIYEVDRIRDGKSFTTRRVVAIQHGQAIYTMAVSFHRDEPGMSHQAKMPEVTKPENLPNEAHIKERVLPLMPDPVRRYYERERPIEWRPVELDRYLGKKIEDGRFHVWIRATARLPDEPAIHQCVLAYASDMLLLDSALIPHGRTVFEQTLMAASLDHALWFHRDEPGMSHQAKMPEVIKPEDLPNEAHIKERVLPLMPDPVRRYYERERPIEWRPVELDRYLGKKIEDGRFHVWIRATARLPDEPAIHQCVLAYASDMLLLDSALIPHGRTVFEQTLMAASLDHALWFHRPFRADDWLLYAHDSPNLSGSRGFSRGLIFARDGTLVASVAQEGLLRERKILR